MLQIPDWEIERVTWQGRKNEKDIHFLISFLPRNKSQRTQLILLDKTGLIALAYDLNAAAKAATEDDPKLRPKK